jgi:DNA mismatch repair ATPase MutS
VSIFYGRKVVGYFVDISYLSTMLKIGLKLSELDNKEIFQIKELKKLKEFSVSLNKKIGWLVIDKSKLNDLSASAIEYFNYFCLFNIVSFVRSIHYISANREKLKRIYELIGSLDATIAIASYIKSLPYYCCAEFNINNHINVDNIYHPLLEKPVSNSFHLQNKSVLVTGSNMAGKTTFIKTIGLNIILNRTISICLAKEANLPECIIKSSIKRADDINENKSYYFKEIEAVLEFIKVSSNQNSYLFLVDEIFRGTNTIERIAAATSVLKHLTKYNLLLVTTHDIELQKLLDNKFDMYHFSEQIEDKKHYFNYQIQSGPTSSRNAIKLLELKGYPKNVVREANDLAEQFTLNGNLLQTLV